MGMMLEGERVEINAGNFDRAAFIDFPGDYLGDTEDDFVRMWLQWRRKGWARDRHNTINRRFNQFNFYLVFTITTCLNMLIVLDLLSC